MGLVYHCCRPASADGSAARAVTVTVGCGVGWLRGWVKSAAAWVMGTRPFRVQLGGQPPALPAARYQPIVDIGRFPLLLLYLPVGVGNREAGDPTPRSGVG